MTRDNLKFLVLSFISWRISLFIFLFFALSTVSLNTDFLGGGLTEYLKNPHLWAWINFDGEHYLSIAYQGYQPLTYFYFPAYPLLTRLVATLFDQSYKNLAVVGLLVSNISLLFTLLGLYKLVLLDFKKKVAYLAIALLLLFPTSFFLGSFYTESLFLALAVWSFYLARQKAWFWAAVLASLASATRVVGLALFPALILEWWFQSYKTRQKPAPRSFFYLFLAPLGLIFYMAYLQRVTGDPLEFLHSVEIFGQQRSSTFVILPQVFYRYFVRILPSLNYNYFPVVFSTLLEITTALLFLALSIAAFFRLRLSYAAFLALGYIIPTLSGSFSSLPRYVLVLFPGFILMAYYLNGLSRSAKLVIMGVLSASLAIATAMFVRGYWIA